MAARELRVLLDDRHLAVKQEHGASPFEAFMQVRLVPGDELQANMESLRHSLAQMLLNDPPYELRWIRSRIRDQVDLAPHMLGFITNPAIFHVEVLVQALGSDSKEMEDLLALRGMLGCGLLVHCLERRNRKDYGQRPGDRRMAVPYRAADTPSERSQFGHPDVAIICTILAYYDDGLTEEQVRHIFETLLEPARGLSAQREIYSHWYPLSKHSMTEEERVSLDMVDKVDLSNDVQRECYDYGSPLPGIF